MKILDIPQSGKRGLYVSQNGRYGQISRINVVPANPRTTDQSNVRERLTKMTQAWRGLTANQRTAWIGAASKLQTRPRCGTSGMMTGSQYFAKVNCNLALMGAAAVLAPPQAVTMPALVPSALVITNTLGVIAIKLVCGDDPTEYTVIRACPPQSAGVTVCNNYRVLGECPQPVLGKSDITAMYVAKFGEPAVGAKVFVSANQMVDGWTDYPKRWSALVPNAE